MSARGRGCTDVVTVGGDVIGVSTAAVAALDGGRLSSRRAWPSDPQPVAHAATTPATTIGNKRGIASG